jgi:probable rRNA maturation factor
MILNRQRRIRVPLTDLRRFLARARRALRLPARSLTVCLVSDAEIARWNRLYRGKKGPTDVLSFPAGEAQAKLRKRGAQANSRPRGTSDAFPSVSRAFSPSYLGDIAIAPGVARRNARRLGRAFNQEMHILVLHGMLHLMGYNHETDSGEMDRRERRLRRALGLA